MTAINHIVITKTENHKYLVHYNDSRIGGPIITGETEVEALLEFKQALKSINYCMFTDE